METSRRYSPSLHPAIIALDIAGFGDSRRTEEDRATAREAMFRLVQRALNAALRDLPASPRDAYVEDRGDGMLLVLSPETPVRLLVTLVPEHLAFELRAHNQGCRPEHRLRLRLVMQDGEIRFDRAGAYGPPIDVAFRLLDSAAARRAFADSSAELAFLVSDEFYCQVVQRDPDLTRAAYRPVRGRVGDVNAVAWVRLLPDPVSEPVVPDLADRDRRDGRDFDAFYLENFRLVRNIVNSRAQDWTLAAEVTDEAMTIAHRKWDELQDHPNPVGFVVVTARRILSKVQRRNARKAPPVPPASLDTIEAEAVEADVAETAVRRAVIDQALRALPVDQRECFVLHAILDRPVKWIAEQLNIPEGTVKTRLRAARRALREILGEDLGEEGRR